MQDYIYSRSTLTRTKVVTENANNTIFLFLYFYIFDVTEQCVRKLHTHLEDSLLASYFPHSVSTSGAFLVSGIYDLLPILSTYVNEPLKMTEYENLYAFSTPHHYQCSLS